jgi:hypothetical protein
MRLALLALLVPLAAVASAAQSAAQDLPDAQAVLDAWAADWRRAAAEVESVEMDETLERVLEGPRRPFDVTAEGSVRYRRGAGPERTTRRVTVNGREVDPERAGRRLGRAFGPAGREVAGPPPPPNALLRRVERAEIEEDRARGRPAWRVTFRPAVGPADRVTAWFTRSERAPRLLRLRAEGRRPGGSAFREVDYVRVDGLDLPLAARAEATVRQRRRLREYVVTLRASARYTGHRVVRAEE